MKSNRIFANIYNDSPTQHTDLFIGVFQLLFWLILRPSAWDNHIQQLDPHLQKSFFLTSWIRQRENFFLSVLLKNRRWKKRQVWKFLIQIFILLPIFTNLGIGMIYLSMGNSLIQVVLIATSVLWKSIIFEILVSSSLGIAAGVVCSIAVIIVGNVIAYAMYSLSIGITVGIALGIAAGISFGAATGTAFSLVFGAVAGVLFSMIFGAVTGSVFVLTVNINFGIVVGVASTIGLWVNWWRPFMMSVLLVPWHALIYRIDLAREGRFPNLLPKHIAFWDEWQHLPIWGLDKHLLLISDYNLIEGQAALNYLSTSRQRWAAQTVQIELDARKLEHCTDAAAVGQIQQILVISELASAADTMFRSFNSISVDVDVALRQFSIYNQRLALTDVVNRLNSLIRELTTSSDKYAVRFRPIAQRWQNIIDLHLQDLIKESELRQEIDSPYIIGVPVTNRQQLFVGRTDISEKLEKLLLDRRSPPLLLYGQRRTGKTSLLNNLGRLLPTSIIPLFVDLQGSISSAKDHTGFLYNLAKGMINSAQRQRNLKLPPLSYETLATDPFTRFDEWLDNLETALAGNTALLALDEFEVLDRVLNEGRFNENDVLGMLRNLIQHRPKFKVLLAGSHTLDEFQRWSSYLINAQLIHLGYLQETEARQLIETPIENFALRYQPPASQRVLDITKGHPFLVQLLCAEIVALKNDQDPSIRRLATLADVEAAIPAALEHGSMFFSDIERNQLDAQSLQVLRYFAQQGETATISKSELEQRFSVGLEGAIDLLLRRELLEIQPAGYCIQLELIRRWFDRP
jgi:hypothetical protein